MTQELEKIKKSYRLLLEAKKYNFPKPDEKLEAPTQQGVYVISAPNGAVLHVGKTSRAKNGLRQRLKNHLLGQSSFTKKYLNGDGKKLRGKHTFKYVRVDNSRLRTLVEAYAIAHLCPKHLGTGTPD